MLRLRIRRPPSRVVSTAVDRYTDRRSTVSFETSHNRDRRMGRGDAPGGRGVRPGRPHGDADAVEGVDDGAEAGSVGGVMLEEVDRRPFEATDLGTKRGLSESGTVAQLRSSDGDHGRFGSVEPGADPGVRSLLSVARADDGCARTGESRDSPSVRHVRSSSSCEVNSALSTTTRLFVGPAPQMAVSVARLRCRRRGRSRASSPGRSSGGGRRACPPSSRSIRTAVRRGSPARDGALWPGTSLRAEPTRRGRSRPERFRRRGRRAPRTSVRRRC